MNYTEDLDKIAKLLIKNQHTVAIAECVTSGLIQHIFSTIENAGLFYEGGITAYNIRQKALHLAIDPLHSINSDAVSKKTAEEMALGVVRSFKSNWGIGITGYTKPVAGNRVNELHACYAICFEQKLIRSSIIMIDHVATEKAKELYVDEVIKNFIHCCKHIEANEYTNKNQE